MMDLPKGGLFGPLGPYGKPVLKSGQLCRLPRCIKAVDLGLQHARLLRAKPYGLRCWSGSGLWNA
jgi:hypothetical protein